MLTLRLGPDEEIRIETSDGTIRIYRKDWKITMDLPGSVRVHRVKHGEAEPIKPLA